MVIPVKPSEAGFGLVEMLVVVAILSILAVGTIFLAFRADGALQRGANMLIQDATQARRLAMLVGLDHAIILKASGWELARKSGAGWHTVVSQQPAGLTVDGPTGAIWVLREDGSYRPVTITLSAHGAELICRPTPERVLVCG